MLRLLPAFARSQLGSIALMAAIAAPALLTAAALAVDCLLMETIRSDLQAAADSAALGSVRELSVSGIDAAKVQALAVALARHNLLAARDASTTDAHGPTASTPRINVEVQRSTNAVSVSIEQDWHPFFLHLLNGKVTPIRATSRAHSLGSGVNCVVGLSDKQPAAIHLMRDARLTAPGCGIYSNSAGNRGLLIDDNAQLKAHQICVVGGYGIKGAGMIDPVPNSDCPPLGDPLAARQPPHIGPCDYNNLVITGQDRTLEPGVYCGGLHIKGEARVILTEGEYVMADGPLRVQGKATLIGEFVGIYLKGAASQIDFDANTPVNLSAPRVGPMAGLLFFEDRSAPPLRRHRIGSNNARMLLGTIYLPRGQLFIDANAPVADNSAYTALVVRSLVLDAGPNLVINSAYGETAVPLPEGLIAGRVVLTK